MKSKRLGRGLGALIPQNAEGEEQQSADSITDLALSLITVNPYQPRTEFDKKALEELKRSIKENGVIQPITVRRAEKGYELIAGERRYRAVLDLGFKRVPAYVMEVSSEEKLLELALIENIQREDLNPIEVAKAYKQLQEQYGSTQEEVAEKVGKDRATVANFIRLLKLPKDIQASLKVKEISMGHARALMGLKKERDQLKLWKKVLAQNWSVRKVEQEVQSFSEKKDAHEPSAHKRRDPYIDDIEERLRSCLGTQVRIKAGNKGGRIEIDYYTNDDLDRIIEAIEGE
ncbi:ParB/RepB/Spo0J family partition protein [bacterium]|nr:ParB/RepB/Spo0J family partition protein [bacterium]